MKSKSILEQTTSHINANASPSTEEIARSWNLWQEYVDPNAEMTREQFDDLSITARENIIRLAFGPEI